MLTYVATGARSSHLVYLRAHGLVGVVSKRGGLWFGLQVTQHPSGPVGRVRVKGETRGEVGAALAGAAPCDLDVCAVHGHALPPLDPAARHLRSV